MVLGTRVLKYWVLGPCGLISFEALRVEAEIHLSKRIFVQGVGWGAATSASERVDVAIMLGMALQIGGLFVCRLMLMALLCGV